MYAVMHLPFSCLHHSYIQIVYENFLFITELLQNLNLAVTRIDAQF